VVLSREVAVRTGRTIRVAVAGVGAFAVAAVATWLPLGGSPGSVPLEYFMLALVAAGVMSGLLGLLVTARLAAAVGGLAACITVPWVVMLSAGADTGEALSWSLVIVAGGFVSSVYFLIGFIPPVALAALPGLIGRASADRVRPPDERPRASGTSAPRAFGRWRVAAADLVFPAGTEVNVRAEGGRIAVASRGFTNVFVDAQVTTNSDATLLVIATESRSLVLTPLDGQDPGTVARDTGADPPPAIP
jgi:hypothetical protein